MTTPPKDHDEKMQRRTPNHVRTNARTRYSKRSSSCRWRGSADRSFASAATESGAGGSSSVMYSARAVCTYRPSDKSPIFGKSNARF